MRLIDDTEFWAGSAFADVDVPAPDVDVSSFREAFFDFMREQARLRRQWALPGMGGWHRFRTHHGVANPNLPLMNLNFAPTISFAAPTTAPTTMGLLEFAGLVDDTREVFRRMCSHDDDLCTCGSVRDSLWLSFVDSFGERYDETVEYWAAFSDADGRRSVTVSELERRFDYLWGFAVAYLSTLPRSDVPPPFLHGLPAEGPAELLIAPLTSAPGAPPALPRLQQTEGYPAAA